MKAFKNIPFMNTLITPEELKTTLANPEQQVFYFSDFRKAGAYDTLYYKTVLFIEDPEGDKSMRMPMFHIEMTGDNPATWLPITRGAPEKGNLNDKRNPKDGKYNPSISIGLSDLNTYCNGFGETWVEFNKRWVEQFNKDCDSGTIKKGSRNLKDLYYHISPDGEEIPNPMITLKIFLDQKHPDGCPIREIAGKPKFTVLDARSPIYEVQSKKTRSGKTRKVKVQTGYEPYILYDNGKPVPITSDNLHIVLKDGTRIKQITWIGNGLTGAQHTFSMPMILHEIVIFPFIPKLTTKKKDDDLISDGEDEDEELEETQSPNRINIPGDANTSPDDEDEPLSDE